MSELKPCACPGCEEERHEGSIFCGPHRWSDNRIRFIHGKNKPALSMAELAFMMQRDGEQQ